MTEQRFRGLRGLSWRTLAPSLADLFFAALMAALFARGRGLESLLSDGDTGWHIRTGEYILAGGGVPDRDPFSFSRPGAPWFAWEWLSDVLFAGLHGAGGLRAVAAFAAVVLCLSILLILLRGLDRDAGLWAAGAAALAAASASTVHYLARPHIFSLLLLPAGLWALEKDRRRPSPALWLLVPLAALWANLHGGFVVWLAVLGLLPVACALERDWRGSLRYGRLAVLSLAATLANPYGWKLHGHIARYLGSSWILDNVQEFQSPRIRSENMVMFALLLLAGVALAGRAVRRGRWFEPLLVLSMAFAALRSARHVPLYAAAAAPLIAGECAELWKRAAAVRRKGSVLRVLWDAGEELGSSRRVTLWAPCLAGLVLFAATPGSKAFSFPADRFPVEAVERNLAVLAPGAGAPRVLSSDQWADYLIFRFYPQQRVFFDGRSDFYGPGVGGDYQALLSASPRWKEALARYNFDAALLPLDWPLATLLEQAAGWRCVYRDSTAVLLLKKARPGADEQP
jgi:hypothetical protein